jgi:2-desacetyl-2-hydroxyethyl bacteriochlorophyllide A dehydrogenase
MKAAVFHAPGQLQIEEIPYPEVGPDDVVVKVHACGICGSDLHGYRVGLWVEPGEVMGHEWAGEVVDVGKTVTYLQPGDRVAVGDFHGVGGGGSGKSVGYGLPGAYAEYVRIPYAQVPGRVGKIPSELDYDEAAALEPVRCGLHAAKLANPDVNDWAVVLGAGMIGLACMQALRVRSSCRVIAVDISARRLALARELGAQLTIDARSEDVLTKVKEITGEGHYRWGAQAHGRWSLGAQADVVVEAAGTATTLKQALELVRHGGTVVQIALFEQTVEFDPTIITQKQIRLQGCAGGERFALAADLVRTGRIRIKPFITHHFPLEQVTEAFETQLRSDVSGKVIVAPWMA